MVIAKDPAAVSGTTPVLEATLEQVVLQECVQEALGSWSGPRRRGNVMKQGQRQSQPKASATSPSERSDEMQQFLGLDWSEGFFGKANLTTSNPRRRHRTCSWMNTEPMWAGSVLLQGPKRPQTNGLPGAAR